MSYRQRANGSDLLQKTNKIMKKTILNFALIFCMNVFCHSQTTEKNEYIPIECSCCSLQRDDDGKLIPPFTDPEFPGGENARMRFLIANLRYPVIARDNYIQGTVFLQYRIAKDGSVADVEVLEGVFTPLDVEAVRVVKTMPKWKPATQFGNPICTPTFKMPIRFSLGGVPQYSEKQRDEIIRRLEKEMIRVSEKERKKEERRREREERRRR